MVNERLRKITPPAFPFGNTMEETKQNMLDVLLTEEYGFLPNRETALSWEVNKEEPTFAAGKATLYQMTMHATFPTGTFSFPFVSVIPKNKENIPFFVHINFRPDVPDRYQPTEELVDNGYAVISFCHKDVTSDDGDFGEGECGRNAFESKGICRSGSEHYRKSGGCGDQCRQPDRSGACPD